MSQRPPRNPPDALITLGVRFLSPILGDRSIQTLTNARVTDGQTEAQGLCGSPGSCGGLLRGSSWAEAGTGRGLPGLCSTSLPVLLKCLLWLICPRSPVAPGVLPCSVPSCPTSNTSSRPSAFPWRTDRYALLFSGLTGGMRTMFRQKQQFLPLLKRSFQWITVEFVYTLKTCSLKRT